MKLRVKFLRKASLVFFKRYPNNSAVEDKLSALITRYDEASSPRNKITHAIVVQTKKSNGDTNGYFLIPPFHSSKNYHLIPPTNRKNDMAEIGAFYWYVSEDVYKFAFFVCRY